MIKTVEIPVCDKCGCDKCVKHFIVPVTERYEECAERDGTSQVFLVW